MPPVSLESDEMFQAHAGFFMSTIQQVTDHLDDLEGDNCNTTLLMLGAKHAALGGFDSAFLT